MKFSNKIILVFSLLIAVAILYRLIPMPSGVYGFTPMFAMAIFGGVLFKADKKYAFALPLITFFLSDVLFEILYKAGKWSVPGFYSGQLVNYILFALTTCVGFYIKKAKFSNIAIASIVAPTLFYVLSNFSVWLMGAYYPKSLKGLKECYIAGWPFYFPYSILTTLVFSTFLFGIYSLIKDKISAKNNFAA
ncbi:DUF6580 family putative transport protein [Arachidicoccus soli]|uniref:Uncharacterized protein n=1 Tax=Arachidicoccus soli TaxID=2341117 RepID=A0A386HSD3_9BACT|nr:DUF6580 family putative transport protein [Arachidicoccus soli]AYD48559.1 hypothetical protein D6B99_13690 [Arachidicoccus soli]